MVAVMHRVANGSPDVLQVRSILYR